MFRVAGFLLLALTQVLGSSITSYEGFKVIRVELYDRSSSELLHELVGEKNVEFWSDLPEQHADLMIDPNSFEKITNLLTDEGFEFNTMIENVNDLIRLEKIKAANNKDFEPNADRPMNWTEYHSGAEIDAYLKYLQQKFPDLVSLQNIGQSYEKRDMNVIKICKGGCGSNNKPAIWIDGGIHAREWITPAVVTYIIHQLVEVQASSDSDLLDNVDWYILPLLNPDGYEFTRNGDRLWRKTRSVNKGSTCLGCDANRNWGYHFGGDGSSPDPCDDTFHGPSAFSEVENQHVRDFITAQKDTIKFFNTIHSYSQIILLPWGFTEDLPPTYDKIKNFADKANEALHAVHGTNYTVGNIPSLLYVASGGSLDWALGVANIPYSIGMELRDTGKFGFLLPTDQIIPTGEEVWAFQKAAARQIIKDFPEHSGSLGLKPFFYMSVYLMAFTLFPYFLSSSHL